MSSILLHYNERESVRRIGFFCNFFVTDPTLVNTSTSDHEKHEKVRQYWRQKREKKHVYA